MKVLSVQQPWATLICAGIKDVENRTWKPQENPGRILIHASKKFTASTFAQLPYEWQALISNHMVYGNLPSMKEFPAGSIIGYVDVVDFVKDAHSLWQSPDEDSYKWVLKDAWLFDEPITGIKGKLHLFDYDINPDNLPSAHKASIQLPHRDDDELVIPVNKGNFETFNTWGSNEEHSVELDIDNFNADVLCEPGVYTLKPVKTIRFVHGDQHLRFEVLPSSESYFETDAKGELCCYFSIFNENGTNRARAAFDLGKRLN